MWSLRSNSSWMSKSFFASASKARDVAQRPDPSGMTSDHSFPVLENEGDSFELVPFWLRGMFHQRLHRPSGWGGSQISVSLMVGGPGGRRRKHQDSLWQGPLPKQITKKS